MTESFCSKVKNVLSDLCRYDTSNQTNLFIDNLKRLTFCWMIALVSYLYEINAKQYELNLELYIMFYICFVIGFILQLILVSLGLNILITLFKND